MATQQFASIDKRYEQLNLRSRSYTAQLWQIPVLYLALLAWMSDKFQLFGPKPNATASLALAVITFVTWIYVTQLKRLERHAVRRMQLLEEQVDSTGGTVFFLSFVWYVRLALALFTAWCVCVGVKHSAYYPLYLPAYEYLLPMLVVAVYATLYTYDLRASQTLVSDIQGATKPHQQVIASSE